MTSLIYQKPVCQRDIYQNSPSIFGSSNEKTGASPEHQTPKNTPVLSLLSLPSAAGPSLCRYSRKLYRPAKGSTGCGTQQIFRALGGTHISLTTAPTTPPCFGHWPRSSSLPSGRAVCEADGEGYRHPPLQSCRTFWAAACTSWEMGCSGTPTM